MASHPDFSPVTPVPLFYREYGQDRKDRGSVLILHGIFGMSDNWHTIARWLGAYFHVVVPDLRNHGRSPHVDEFTFPAMAADLTELARKFNWIDSSVPLFLLGHSMGGKLAMWMATHLPWWCERLSGLVVVDIAPVRTEPSEMHLKIFEVFEESENLNITHRSELLRWIREEKQLPERIVLFLSKMVVTDPKEGRWHWRIHWKSLRAHYEQILQGIDEDGNAQKCPSLPVLAVLGGKSSFVSEEGKARMQYWFPRTTFVVLKEAGHWVHADQPQIFFQVVLRFLQRHAPAYIPHSGNEIPSSGR